MNFKMFTKTIFLICLTVFVLSACSKKQETVTEEQKQEALETVIQAESELQETIETEAEKTDELIQDFVGEMDLSGSWDDEVSRRASMDVTRNDDGSYDIYVHWGGSATETAIWEIHGTYDEISGMLTYENGAYSIHTWDSNNNETVSGEEITKGAFMKEGEKLRWTDSKNTDDALFVKTEQ